MYKNIHTLGKDDSLDDPLGMTAAVVLRLVEPVNGRGHHIYMDNYYTSPALFSRLRSLGFGACGTLRLTRRGVPAEAKARLEKGERRLVPVDEAMNVVQWHDKRLVSVLSTIHDDTPVAVERRSRRAPGGREMVEKPQAVVEYNKYMGGVDLGDQLLTYSHRTRKWWRRTFFFLFDAAVVNSYTLYRQQQQERGGRCLTHEQFRVELAKDLLAEANTATPLSTAAALSATPASHGQHPEVLNPQSRLHDRHFPGQLGKTAAGKQIQHDCTVCSKRKGRGRKTTTYCCKQCQLPMCTVPCFELYHTKVDPQRYL